MKGAWNELAGLKYVEAVPDDEPSDLPLIVAIHGRGADATDLAGLASELFPESYRWVLPQGPRPVNLGGGYTGWAWYELGEQQAETVVHSRDILMSFLDELLTRLGVARERAVLMGFSQGAVMTMHAGLASPEPYAGLIAMSGYLPAAETLSPLLPDRRDRKLLMVHGIHDQVLNVRLGREARDFLQAAGLQLEYEEFPMDHQITADSLTTVRRFLQEVLPPEASPQT
jgi:phospholipase/carboxylesterase